MPDDTPAILSPATLSPNERIKGASRHLRGTIADGLSNAVTGALADDDTQLTKFHGIYQQDDRDLRPERRSKRSEEHTSELQSLMRISYAVVCSKKKNNQ